MLTAIVSAALVIAVIIYVLCVNSGRISRIEEDESYKWAVKWNKQREAENCDKWCGDCDDLSCPFREV